MGRGRRGGQSSATEVAFKGVPGQRGSLKGVGSPNVAPGAHHRAVDGSPCGPQGDTKAGCKAGMRGKISGGGGNSVSQIAVGTAPGQRGSLKGVCSRNFAPGACHHAMDGCPYNILGGAGQGACYGFFVWSPQGVRGCTWGHLDGVDRSHWHLKVQEGLAVPMAGCNSQLSQSGNHAQMGPIFN